MSLWGRPRARGGQGQGAGPPLTLSVLLVTRGPCPPPVPPLPHVLGPDSVACLCVTGKFLRVSSLPSCISVSLSRVSGGLYVSYHALFLSPLLLLLAPPPPSTGPTHPPTGPSPSFYWLPQPRGRLAAPCRQILMTWGGSHFPLTWGQLGR